MRIWLVVFLFCALVWQSEAWRRRRRRRTTSRCWSWPSKGTHVTRYGCSWPFHHGETCNFACKSGYGYHSGSSSRQCINGAWTGSKYICRRCTFPPLMINAVRTGCAWPYLVNEQCNFACKSGYTYVSGSSIRTCQNNNGLTGHWTGSTYICKKRCLFGPTLPWHNVVKFNCGSPYDIGETCDFQCKPGYIYDSGDAQRTCTTSGWDGSPYKCKGEYTYT
ncbi:PREDICTED: E-selectin-like [Branchiostoma belcheri]|uniref:E-selectin-like n=1 Tax=Branchiostoma belcheri TaxID=7741 RepID=A0A6P5A287_BRABE|nr:PREDICTED: E-selectin-like [Branchiostoma belcheri]